MPMDSVTDEHVEKIMKEYVETQYELAILLETPLHIMWIRELDAFDKEYDAYKAKRMTLAKPSTTSKSTSSSTSKSKAKK